MGSVGRPAVLSIAVACLPCLVGLGAGLAAPDARAEGDDHALTAALVTEVAGDVAHAPLTAELLGNARRQLERATAFRATYDEKRARAADAAAREWAETARDVLRAVDGEVKAVDVRRKAVEALAQVDRTRARVDEDTARIGRLKAELANAEKEAREAADPDRRAVEMHEGEPAPKKVPKKPAPAKAAPAATAGSPAGAAAPALDTGSKP